MTTQTTTEVQPESASVRLGNHVFNRREDILDDWKTEVANDTKLHRAGMTEILLLGRVPQLLDHLAVILRYPGNHNVDKLTSADVREHVLRRRFQGFGVSECLLEFDHLRSALEMEIVVFDVTHEDLGFGARLTAAETVHNFMDHLERLATELILRKKRSA